MYSFLFYFPISLSMFYVAYEESVNTTYLIFNLFSNKCRIIVRFAIAKNWLKRPVKVIGRTQAVTTHFLKKSFKKLYMKKKNPKNTKIVFF